MQILRTSLEHEQSVRSMHMRRQSVTTGNTSKDFGNGSISLSHGHDDTRYCGRLQQIARSEDYEFELR